MHSPWQILRDGGLPLAIQGAGEDSSHLLTWAAKQFSDDNRYLKLRRIAIENLAHVL